MAYTTIDDPTKFFSNNLWVGDDTSPRTLTGFGHQPDFVWARYRDSGSLNHVLTDSVRGGDKMVFSNTNAAEDTKSHGEITSFNSDGITVADGTNSTYPRLYFNDDDPFGGGTAGNYVGWSWKGGGTAVSNGDGDITSTVSANTTSGFSVVKYTGNGNSSATFGHGLGVKPKIGLLKPTSTTGNWNWWQDTTGNNSADVRVHLHLADANNSNYPITFNTNTITLPSLADASWNGSGTEFIFYCFAEKQGYSKFGKYAGNGNSDGAFVYTGFQPAWIIVKNIDSAENWIMYDNKRDPINVMDTILRANTDAAENTSSAHNIDFLSNGFKQRNSDNQTNKSSEDFIYMAFAQNPFVTEGTKAAGTAR